MKKALAYLLAASMTFGLVACGGNSGSTASTTSGGEASTAAAEASTAAEEASQADTSAAEASEAEAPEEPAVEATVTIWHTYTEGQLEYLENAVKEFNDAHPGMTVVAESQPYDGFTDKVYQAVMAGNGPDIIIHYASEAALYVADGKLVNMEEYLAPETLALMPEGTKAEATSFADGHMHILPIVSSGPILFYNADLYEELNLTAPETWEDLVANCEAIKAAHPDVAGFGFDSEVDGCQTLIMQTGITPFDADGLYFNTDDVAAQMQFYQDNIQNGNFTNVKIDNYFSNNFNQGVLGAYVGSAAGVPYLGKNQDESFPNVGMGKVPQGGNVNWTPAWNRGIIIFNYEDEDRAKVAAAFTDYFASAEVNAGWCVACNYPATFPATMDTQTFQDFASNNESFSYLHPEYAGAFPAVTTQAYARKAFEIMMSEVAGGKDVNEALQDAVDYIETELAEE